MLVSYKKERSISLEIYFWMIVKLIRDGFSLVFRTLEVIVQLRLIVSRNFMPKGGYWSSGIIIRVSCRDEISAYNRCRSYRNQCILELYTRCFKLYRRSNDDYRNFLLAVSFVVDDSDISWFLHSSTFLEGDA